MSKDKGSQIAEYRHPAGARGKRRKGPSLQGLYFAVEDPRMTALPHKKRARKAQKLARKGNRSKK